MGESFAEIFKRFPDSVVQKDAALANRAMKLCGPKPPKFTIDVVTNLASSIKGFPSLRKVRLEL